MRAQAQNKDELESRAADWILRRDRAELTSHQRAELEAWLSADSRHRDAYLKLDELWRASAGLKNWRPIDGDMNLSVLANGAPQRSNGKGTRAFALAASLMLFVAAGVFLWNRSAFAPTYATQVGGYQRVLLDDGSVVQLNTDTKIRARITRTRREISLLRGEAYFEVAPDAKRPFDVLAGDTSVRALGTRFAVYKKESGTEVTVTQGKVAVAAITLTSGQAAKAKPEGMQVARLEEGELNRRLAWQSGELRFNKQPLAEVVAEFNRYNRRRLEIVNPRLAAVEVGGSFKANDLESFVAAMRGTLGIQAEESAAVIRLK